jgi:hypothetical protein
MVLRVLLMLQVAEGDRIRRELFPVRGSLLEWPLLLMLLATLKRRRVSL